MLSVGMPALIAAVLLAASLYFVNKMPKARNRASETVGELKKGFNFQEKEN